MEKIGERNQEPLSSDQGASDTQGGVLGVTKSQANYQEEAIPVQYDDLNEYHKLIYPWQQHLDPTYQRYFFHNQFTGESVWALPEHIQEKVDMYYQTIREKDEEIQKRNMDKFVEDVDAKIAESDQKRGFDWMSRPARRQVDTPLSARFAYKQGDEVYNIWYDKYLSDDKFKEREQAVTRLNPETDVGYTKADLFNKNQSYFCFHFSKGCCVEGQKCRYYHHVPTLEECLAIDQIKDIFGRTRHANQRDDNEGVGSFTKETRTLRVSDFCLSEGYGDNVSATYEVLWRHFGLLGQLEDIHLVPDRCIAFIRYAHRCMAEFAKEAMANQPLESNEIMVVKWSDKDIVGHDPTEILKNARRTKETNDKKDDKRKKKKGKNDRQENLDKYQEDIERAEKEEKMLQKRLESKKEYTIIEQRLDQIHKNSEVMDNVLKKLKTLQEQKEDKEKEKGSEGRLDLDSFMKSYKAEQPKLNPSLKLPVSGQDPALNSAPLFQTFSKPMERLNNF